MELAEEAHGLIEAKRERRLIELPVPIGGTIYIPYKIRDIDGSISQGIEEGALTGYVDEGEDGRRFYTYQYASSFADVPVEQVCKTRREALAALETMEAT